MSRIAYVDGAYVALSEAAVSVEDRGFQFADSVYEVWGVGGGRLIDRQGHLDRLFRSLDKLSIRAPAGPSAIMAVVEETRRRNRVRDGLVYLQATRGAAPRDHLFPAADTAPTLVVTARSLDKRAIAKRVETGVGVVTLPDIRWGRCDIKSVSLLPNVLAKQAAKEKGATEAWLIDRNGYVTEGASSNAWIITTEDVIKTRPLGDDILAGVTRARVLGIAAEMGLALVEQAFSPQEALGAQEAFLTSASALVIPVVSIDGAAIANGRPGHRTLALRDGYLKAIARDR